jgi:hypothetical protein
VNVANITRCERSSGISEGAETSRTTATKRTVSNRYTASSLLTLSNAKCVIPRDVRAATRVGRLILVAGDLVDFA